MTWRRTERRDARRSLPIGLVLPALLALLLFAVPIIGLLASARWGELLRLLFSETVKDALRLSLLSSIGATVVSGVLGVPLAWLIARAEFRGIAALRSLVLLPLVLPPVVGGAALLFALGRSGVLGGPIFSATGLSLPFSIWGVILANTFVAMPFLVISVEGAFRNLDQKFESAASSLGAGRMTVFRRVTLPLIWPSLTSGLLLTWARAFGEFGATLTFAGSLPGRTQTMPLAVFVALESDRDMAVALSILMVVVALGVLISLRDRWWGAN